MAEKWISLISGLLALMLLTGGCAELHRRGLGTRVHSFSAGGRDYVHCSILVDQAQPQMAHDALQVCEDGIRQSTAQPHK